MSLRVRASEPLAHNTCGVRGGGYHFFPPLSPSASSTSDSLARRASFTSSSATDDNEEVGHAATSDTFTAPDSARAPSLRGQVFPGTLGK